MSAILCATLVLALSLACLWRSLHAFRHRSAVVGVVSVAAVLWGVVCGLAPTGPLRVFVVMHEGGTACTLSSYFGDDLHAGWLWRDGLRGLVRDAAPVAWLSRVNLACAGFTVVGIVMAVVVATRSVVAGVVALALVDDSRAFRMGALSETPAPAIWFATVAALPAWRMVADGARYTPRARLLALSSLVACGALAAGVRTETVIVSVPVVCVALATWMGGAARLDAARVVVRGLLRRALASPWQAWAVALYVVWMLARLAEMQGFGALVVAAALPSHEMLRLPFALPAALSLPAAALATVGLVAGFSRGTLEAVTALATLQLLAVYLAASHNVGWEMLRYATMGAGFLWLHALAGWMAIERYATGAGWTSTWRGSAVVVFSALVMLRSRSNPNHPGWWNASVRDQDIIVQTSKQRESEALLRAVIDAPRCVFVARVRRDGVRDGPMVLATFGWGVPVRYEASPEVAMAALPLRGVACVKYFRTLDCNGGGGERCDEDVRGATPERVTTERWATYSDPSEYGLLAPVVRYGTWRVPAGTFASR